MAAVTMTAVSLLSACGGSAPKEAPPQAESGSRCEAKNLEEMAKQAAQEKAITSYGMPDDWANWQENWARFTAKYNLTHTDTDMSSADEIAKFLAEKEKPVADVGDMGIAFGKMAREKGAVAAYQPQHWGEVPDGLKDPEGYWTAAYRGTIVFMVNTAKAPFVPRSFADLLDPRLKGMVSTSDPMKASQGQAAVAAAAFARGGSETNIGPGIAFWQQVLKQGNYKQLDVLAANWQKGELVVGVMWDFNALNYRKHIGMERELQIVVPTDATISVPYVAVINRWAPHPCAARLWQEWLFSDEGQSILAKGYARPIRSNVKLPDEIQAAFPPEEAYRSARMPQDWAAYSQTGKEIKDRWESEVLPHMR